MTIEIDKKLLKPFAKLCDYDQSLQDTFTALYGTGKNEQIIIQKDEFEDIVLQIGNEFFVYSRFTIDKQFIQFFSVDFRSRIEFPSYFTEPQHLLVIEDFPNCDLTEKTALEILDCDKLVLGE